MSIDEMRRKAEAGSCVNQCTLDLRYLYGVDVETDYEEAFRFLSAAAKQGSSRAVLNLGYMYARGLGIPQDVPESIRLFEAVARPPDSSDAFIARIELGRIYSGGSAVPMNVQKAVEWYSAAIAVASANNDSGDLEEAKAYVASANAGR